MNLTLDGVAPGNDGGLDVVDLANGDSWDDVFTTVKTVDTMLVGGTSAKEYLAHWHTAATDPKAEPNERTFGEIAERTPHVVLSRTMTSIDFKNATILSAGVDGIAELKRQSGGDMLIWGGPTVAGAAIDAGVIDEYHFVVHPAISGRGKKLFANVASTHRLRTIDMRTLASGVLLVKYGVATQ
jgi:dihydrofolate reductase